MLRKSGLAVVATLVLVLTQVTAQEQTRQQPQQESQFQRQQTTPHSGHEVKLDQALARWLLTKNESAIRLSQFGQQQAQDPQVREFADRMIQDHRKLSQQLQPFAGRAGFQSGTSSSSQLQSSQSATQSSQSTRDQSSQASRDPSSPSPGTSDQQSQATRDPLSQPSSQTGRDASSQTSQERTSAGQSSQSHTSAAGQHGALEQLLSIHEQVESKCGETLKKGLQKKQGAQFDQTFMGLQILGHMKMIDTVQVMQQHASPQLQDVLEQAQQSAQQHLEMAEEINQKLETSVAAERTPQRQ
jgi:predicted outer membrane protein